MRYILVSIVVWAMAVPAFADGVGVQVGPREVTLSAADLKLTVSREDAALQLRVGDTPCTLTPSLQLGTGWTPPARSQGDPQVTREAGEITVRLAYPVPQDRRFSLEIRAVPEPACFVVTSRLSSLTLTRPEYYYWQTSLNSPTYSRPGAAGPETVAFNTKSWDAFEWQKWIWIPLSKRGLVVLPTNCGGRSGGEAGCIFLHALPRSNVLAPGESLDARFALASAADAAGAATLAERISERGLVQLPLPLCATGGLPASDKSRATGGLPASVFPAETRPAAASTQVATSQPASPKSPTWLKDAEIYNLFYRSAAEWTDKAVGERLRGFPFIIGSTPDRAALEKCHKNGVKLLHYVIYTCLLDTDLQVARGGKVYSEWTESIDNESRDLKNHPDWVCIRADGSSQPDGWGQAHGHPGLLNTCLHQPALQEAALRQVRMLMDAGYDGVFIDLAGPVEECYGPKAGKHSHPGAFATNTEAYNDLLGRIYRLVKSYGDDRIVIQNTCTFMSPARWATTDVQMLEAWPFGGDSTAMLPTWPELQWAGVVHGQTAERQGRSPVILSYFGKFTAANVRESALFSLAYARLYGLLWADSFTLAGIPSNEQFARSLYAVRLGEPVGGIETSAPVSYRRFERGLALLNPTARTVSVRIPAGPLTGSLTDMGYDRPVQPADGKIVLDLAPKSGRILLTR